MPERAIQLPSGHSGLIPCMQQMAALIERATSRAPRNTSMAHLLPRADCSAPATKTIDAPSTTATKPAAMLVGNPCVADKATATTGKQSARVGAAASRNAAGAVARRDADNSVTDAPHSPTAAH